jgi:signal transduction histidine kinase/ActR/RegA family two-component response regulator
MHVREVTTTATFVCTANKTDKKRGSIRHRASRFHVHLHLILLVLTIFIISSDAGADDRNNILILNSYHQGFRWTDDITRGVVSALDPVSGEARIYIEYMNTKWANGDRYYDQLFRLLKIKYSKTRFALIVCSDTDAFVFLRDHRDDLFGPVPTVFCGVNYFKNEDLRGKQLFTGVSETADLRETFDLALKLHPRTKGILVINDNGIAGSKVREEIDKLAPLYRGKVNFTFENKTDLDGIIRDVSVLPRDTLIFYTFFYGDPATKFYENTESISRISQHAKVPVFGAWDFNLGAGMVGGKLTSGYEQGKTAGRMGLRILKGEAVEGIPIVYRNPSRYMFDYRQMERFHISKSLLPEGSIVVNEPEAFHKIRKGIVWATLAGILGLAALVFFLLFIIERRRRAEKLLKCSNDELEKKVGERTRELSDLNCRLSEVNRQLADVNQELSDDIRKRLQAEEDLRKSQRILNKIFEANPDHLVVLDRELRTVHSNWIGGYEYAPPEIRHQQRCCLDGLMAEGGKPCEPCTIMDVFRTGKPVITEKFVKRIGHLEIRAVPIFNDNGDVILVAEHIRDVSERKKMEQEILKSQKLESIGVLAGGIAHDFNNLLTGIIGNISLAKMYAGPETKAKLRLDEAEKACERAAGLTRQLLTFSKGGAPIKKESSIVQILVESAGFVLRGSNVRCEFSLPDDLRAVEIDEGQMSQVAGNLFINAAQAMPNGGIITVRGENVNVSESDSIPLRNGKYIRISVRDQGTGIAEENLPRIFDPYFTTKENGSGLGLATVYSIMKQHQGHLSVETTLGVGTVFHLYLPASSGTSAPDSAGDCIRNSDRGAERILVMDDEEMVREIAREILTHLGHEVDVCNDGESAVALYQGARDQGEPYSAVIMDLTIPGRMGGAELMKELLKIDPDARGIVSSGYNNDPILACFGEYGFSATVAKPYTVNELYEALQSL